MQSTLRNKLFDIRPGEGMRVALFFLFSFLLGVSFNFLETTAFPLFLIEFDSQTLPYIYIINAFVVSIITALYLRLGTHVRFTTQLLLNLIFLLGALLAFRLGLALEDSRWVVFSLPILFQIVVSLGAIAYWTLAGQVFNVRQAKRLFGLLGAGMWVAIVCTGFIIPSIVKGIGTTNLLTISAAGMGASLICLFVIVQRYGGDIDHQQHSASTQRESDSLRSYLKDRYILLMFSLSVLAWLAFFFVDNMFYNRVAARFPNEDQVAGFLGIYLAVLGILALISTTFLSGPFISRYGVRNSLLVLPFALLIGTILLTGTGTIAGLIPILFIFTTLNKLLNLSLGFSIDQSAQTILYQPLPSQQRSRVQTFDDGVVRMLAIGVAGLLLVFLNGVLNASVVQMGYVLLVILVVWIISVRSVGKEYPKVLMQSLLTRRLTGSDIEILDDSSLEILEKTSQEAEAGAALHAIKLLDSHVPERVSDLLPSLLNHHAPAIRRTILQRIEERKRRDLLPNVEHIWHNDRDPNVQAAAFRTLAALGDGAILELANTDRAQESPVVQASVLTNLYIYGDPRARNFVLETLKELVASKQVGGQILAAEVIGAARIREEDKVLLRFLDDANSDLVRSAMRAASGVNEQGLWLRIIDLLGEPSLRSAAVLALASTGALPFVIKKLHDPETPREIKYQLLRICGRIGTEEAVTSILQLIFDPNPQLRQRALREVEAIRYHATTDIEDFQAQLLTEIDYASWLLTVWLDCKPDTATDESGLHFLNTTLVEQFELSRLRILIILSIIYGWEGLDPIHDSMIHGTPGQRANAVELLDTILPRETMKLLSPLMEEHTLEQRHQRLQARFPHPSYPRQQRLLQLASAQEPHIDRWTRICAIYTLGALQLTADSVVSVMARTLEDDHDPLLLEMVTWSLVQLGDEAYQGFLQALERVDKHKINPIYERFNAHGGRMLSTLEKLLILKDVDLFENTSDEILADVAALATEVQLARDELLFTKGEEGDCMYIINSGCVRVHDGDRTINTLAAGQVFGEMALLDPEPRMASISALEETHLLRLDQAAFTELMEYQIEVTRGIIRVLTRRLRDCVARGDN